MMGMGMCTTDPDCAMVPDMPVCSAGGMCVECTLDNDDECGLVQVCDTDTNECVDCTGDGDCIVPGFEICDLDSQTCVECIDSDDCDVLLMETCINNECV